MTNGTDAHQIALEWLKQIIGLSSGIIALSGTFIASSSHQIGWPLLILGAAWILFGLAIVLALDVIGAITSSRLNDNDSSWARGTPRDRASAAKTCFIIGVGLFVMFAATSVFVGPNCVQSIS